MTTDAKKPQCADCGLELTEQTEDQFVGRPGDFAHSAWACAPRVLAAVRVAGFRVGPDPDGRPTLRCVSCGGDSGRHRAGCERAAGRAVLQQVREAVEALEREELDPNNDCGDVGDTQEKTAAALRAVMEEFG